MLSIVSRRQFLQSVTAATAAFPFRAWAQANGACFYDETGDPELTIDLYEDGDHFADRLAYTRLFRRRLDSLFR